eukprot:CAMPEP_0206148356 /NCGR_PEP_ID=MMETSP1473-20131121/36386_1 /ASSEMBLY_ACC=CAM_ASM_001109 /TAXON_ID=1461547 /ORGANISM="Stichococcus sp, Strain RCC1054" /LENGTH=145 /DNA_ID=CAMNT_0053545665 /DNA_START=251 /DNA_END=688 /DNA_ORIENTATION=-
MPPHQQTPAGGLQQSARGSALQQELSAYPEMHNACRISEMRVIAIPVPLPCMVPLQNTAAILQSLAMCSFRPSPQPDRGPEDTIAYSDGQRCNGHNDPVGQKYQRHGLIMRATVGNSLEGNSRGTEQRQPFMDLCSTSASSGRGR